MSTNKTFVNRFGVTAVKNGFISQEQLFEALKIQLAEDLKGTQHRLIGQILQAKNYLTMEQTDQVLIQLGGL